jgi:hypothetical protein
LLACFEPFETRIISMKKRITYVIIALVVCASLHRAAAQGTAFTYQGQLQTDGSPASGTYNLTFSLFPKIIGGSAVAGPVTNNAVIVTNGLFTVVIDFGSGVFDGMTNWLAIGVETNGVGTFSTLSPRQQLTPTPNAIFAENAASIGGLVPTNFWQLGGNASTTPGANFLGTTDDQALELKVNGTTALLLQPAPANTVNVAVGPFSGIGLGLSGVTIAGGGYLGGPNLVYENWATISGGFDQQISSGSSGAVIAGGQSQRILTGSGQAAIGGGYDNIIGPGATGGTIPGGWNNLVSGSYGFAAGNTAQATNSGAFVWADNSGGAFASTSNNQFSARALGGVRFVTGGAGMTIDGQPVPTGTAWGLAGTAGTTGTNFLGTTDNHPLEFRVNGGRAGLLLPFPNGSPSVQWGTVNGVSLTGYGGNVIGGGGYIGAPNLIYADFSVIGGGYNNQIYPSCPESVIAGGQGNYIYGSTAVIGGGAFNTNSGGVGCTIPGGLDNVAGGNYSFAAGYYAQATNSGSFVWSDGTGTPTSSASDNSVTFRASGGYRLFSDTGTSGVQLAPGGGSWTSLSDRNAKENFEPVSGEAILERVADMPITTWNYRTQEKSIRHLGPMAQDFYASFHVGENERGITTVDEGGVALAAIQGLNQKVIKQANELKAKDEAIQSLEQRLERLEKLAFKSSGPQ